MKKDDIRLGDIYRILFGEAPAGFMVEVLIRTVIIYVAAIIAMRLLGKRMSGQLTITEFGVMVMLGAIIAPPAQIPERGILVGIFVLCCAVLLQQGISRL